MAVGQIADDHRELGARRGRMMTAVQVVGRRGTAAERLADERQPLPVRADGGQHAGRYQRRPAAGHRHRLDLVRAAAYGREVHGAAVRRDRERIAGHAAGDQDPAGYAGQRVEHHERAPGGHRDDPRAARPGRAGRRRRARHRRDAVTGPVEARVGGARAARANGHRERGRRDRAAAAALVAAGADRVRGSRGDRRGEVEGPGPEPAGEVVTHRRPPPDRARLARLQPGAGPAPDGPATAVP